MKYFLWQLAKCRYYAYRRASAICTSCPMLLKRAIKWAVSEISVMAVSGENIIHAREALLGRKTSNSRRASTKCVASSGRAISILHPSSSERPCMAKSLRGIIEKRRRRSSEEASYNKYARRSLSSETPRLLRQAPTDIKAGVLSAAGK